MVFVGNALNPAKVGRVTILDEQQKILEVTVEDSQLAQAIGKKGQNVRLASQLIGWKIEIKSETEKKREIEDEMGRAARATQEIRSLPGVGEKITSSLLEKGYRSLEQIVEASIEDLCAVPGIGEKTATKIQESAREAVAAREQRTAQEAQEEEPGEGEPGSSDQAFEGQGIGEAEQPSAEEADVEAGVAADSEE